MIKSINALIAKSLENNKSPKGPETERKKGKLEGLENGRVERTSFKCRGYLR